MGVPLEEAQRIGRRPLDRPWHVGKLGAQAQRMGCEIPAQERFTRSPGRPSRGTRKGRGQLLGQIRRARGLPPPPLPSPLPASWIFPHTSHFPVTSPCASVCPRQSRLSQGCLTLGVPLGLRRQQQQQLQNQSHGWDVVRRGGE